MTPPTHLVFSGFLWVFFSGLMGIPLNLTWILAGCVSSLIPDVDTQNSRIGRIFFFVSKRIEKRFGHRSITHSFLGMLIAGFVLSPICLISPTLFAACLLGYSSHVFLDCMNKTGVQLFYPDGIQVVMPGREDYRFAYGGKGEMVLMFVFLSLGIIVFPIADKGFIKFIHYLRGDPEAAVSDFRDYAKNYIVWCNLKGIDSLTNRPIEGRFKVVGALGATTLIISNHEVLRTVGSAEAVNVRALTTRCFKGEEIKVVVNEAGLKEGYLGEVKGYIDLSKEHYVFGILDVEERPAFEERIDRYKNIYYQNNKLVLDYARWSDIEGLGINDVLVKEGHVLVKTIIKKGESMDLTRYEGAERLKGEVISISFSVENPWDLLVKKGQEIKENEPLAKMGTKELRELRTLKKELSYQDYLVNKGIGSNKNRIEVLGKISKIRDGYRSAKLSRFNGEVIGIRVKGVRDGVVSVEVAVEVKNG